MSMRTLTRRGAEIRVYGDEHELALEAARYVGKLADQYGVGTGRFTVALSGGSTPRAMFTLLAEEPFKTSVPWASIYFFWVDERAVPPTHSGSNYRMANETLLSKVPVPAENIFRIRGELDDREQAASEYSEALAEFFSAGSGPLGTSPLGSWPRLDLVLLGMGADGHTASLFPRTPALAVSDKVAVANYVQKLHTHRITLTAGTINNARNVTFLVAGEDKAAALKSVIEGPDDTEIYPSQLIRPRSGALVWLVDEAAAGMLSP
jgi:6-phosphogluconolactonase